MYVPPAFDPFVRPPQPGLQVASGHGVPRAHETSQCSAGPVEPNSAPISVLLLSVCVLGWRRRRRAVAVAVILTALGGCGVEPNAPWTRITLDAEYYASHVDPILARGCATPACHGDPRRPLRIYAVSKLRSLGTDGLNTEITDDEICENFRNVRGFVEANALDESLILTKPLVFEEGGTYHGGGYLFARDSAEYQCILSWLSGSVARFDAQDQVVEAPKCRFAWNIDAGGQRVRAFHRGLQCD
jgi:uncharacterized protein (TIGR03382 family)